ncbi:toprim domain-containing protein [Flavobacterium sp. ASW18X]|uniref:toprim domain-containing protein n=1 Tax=Flavobacterium sp. ASW18X TaxID=2572595 RepID=UPI00146B0077|nr:toprim domain-containing protein [Flavobacterium sp. ASW18X]
MKEKYNYERARNVSIVQALAKLGHFPQKESDKEAWFLSPFRSETQASLKVSKTLNKWYDHGEGIGGNCIDIVAKITTWPIKEVVQLLNGEIIVTSFREYVEEESKNALRVRECRTIQHAALKQYLAYRRIPLTIAHTQLKEIVFQLKQKEYFALGFENDRGGWELRNKYQKLATSPKTVTYHKNNSDKLIVTEGAFDYLSLLTLKPKWITNSDFLILNSLAFVKHQLEQIKMYKELILLLDNDDAGSRFTKLILEEIPNGIDGREYFKGYKDLNEKLQDEFGIRK